MNLSAILQQLDDERRNLARDGETIERLPALSRLHANDGAFYLISWANLAGQDVDAVIRREIDHHARLGVPFEWKVYEHDQPADLRERLAANGLTIGEAEAVMVYDLADRPAWMEVNASDPSLSVRRVDELPQVATFKQVAGEVFGKDYSLTAGQLTDAINAGSYQHRGYVGYLDGTPANVGRLYTHPRSAFAGLYGGGTLPAFRGRGLYRAMVAARARDALAAGAKYLLVDALPTSRPILQRMGFVQLTATWPCEWNPPGS